MGDVWRTLEDMFEPLELFRKALNLSHAGTSPDGVLYGLRHPSRTLYVWDEQAKMLLPCTATTWPSEHGPPFPWDETGTKIVYPKDDKNDWQLRYE